MARAAAAAREAGAQALLMAALAGGVEICPEGIGIVLCTAAHFDPQLVDLLCAMSRDTDV